MTRPTRLIRMAPRPQAGGVGYDNDTSGLTGDTIQEAIDELATLIGTGNFETKNEGGEPTVGDHGTAGATETIDATDGNHHRLTLDQACTITVASFPDGTILVAVYQDSTGGWGITWSGVDFGGGDDQPDLTADSLTFFTIVSEGGSRFGFKAGAGGSASPLTTKGDLYGFDTDDARVPVGTDGYLLTSDSTAGVGVSWQNPEDTGHYEVLMDGGSPPEPLENGSGTDWLYVWVP